MTQIPFFQAFAQPPSTHEQSELPTLSASYLFSNPKSYNSSLQDVLIHYRKPGVNREDFLNQTLSVTRQELKSTDTNLKLQAAYKLLFLFNEGIDIQWAAFNVIEMMASNRFQVKRISYTLVAIIFNDLNSHRGPSSGAGSTEELQQLLTLTPNVFRKDF